MIFLTVLDSKKPSEFLYPTTITKLETSVQKFKQLINHKPTTPEEAMRNKIINKKVKEINDELSITEVGPLHEI